MDEKRLSQAKFNFDMYLEDSLLKKVNVNPLILQKFEDNATESLISASELFNNKTSYLWTVVTSYYAMFYIASAYIYKKGYKAQHKIVHKVINDSLIVLARSDLKSNLIDLYEEEKDKALSIAESLLDSFEFERAKRSTFQYEMTSDLKESRAKTSLKRAKEFVEVFRKLL